MSEVAGAVLIGQTIGYLGALGIFAALVLFAAQKFMLKAFAYGLSAACTLLLAWLSGVDEVRGMAMFSTYAIWLLMWWRFRRGTEMAASKLGRANIAWLGFLMGAAVWALVIEGNASDAGVFSVFGLISMSIGAVGSWVIRGPSKA